MSWLKSILRKLLREYELYQIYERRLVAITLPIPLPARFTMCECRDPKKLAGSEPEIAKLSSYLVADSKCFVVLEGAEVVCACVYWWGDNYAAHRRTWSLQAGEAKLVQVTTAVSHRGLGLASAIISLSSLEMVAFGFHTLYSRIWHSNYPSIQAFRKAGWKRIAFVTRVVMPLFGEKRFVRRY